MQRFCFSGLSYEHISKPQSINAWKNSTRILMLKNIARVLLGRSRGCLSVSFSHVSLASLRWLVPLHLHACALAQAIKPTGRCQRRRARAAEPARQGQEPQGQEDHDPGEPPSSQPHHADQEGQIERRLEIQGGERGGMQSGHGVEGEVRSSRRLAGVQPQ